MKVCSFFISICLLSVCLAEGSAEKKKRIVSLVPSVTETVFALGAGDLLVGVTPYCDYPNQATKLPKVGGLLDPNYEAIVSLKPDVVYLLNDREVIGPRLARLNIRSESVQNESLKAIFESIAKLGKEVNKPSVAEKLISDLKRRIQEVQLRYAGYEPPLVLVTVGGHLGRDSFKAVYGVGRDTIFDELIKLSSGKNVVAKFSGYPSLSAESVLGLNPNVIIDLLPQTSEKSIGKEKALDFWSALPLLNAVRHERIHILTDEYVINPGPRIVDTLEALAAAIHHKGSSHDRSQ